MKKFCLFLILISFISNSSAFAHNLDKDELIKVKKEITQLQKQIKYYDKQYYVKNTSEISDNEYDKLLVKLKTLENKYPQFKSKDSPTQKISNNINSKFKKITHKTKVLSLSKTYNEKELEDWYVDILKKLPGKKVEFVCELKIDGLTAVLNYKNGDLVSGATRGNGFAGEDVTKNVKQIKSLPLKISAENFQNIEIRGEVFMPKSKFKNLGYKNIRNAASGSLRTLDLNKKTTKNLDIFIFSAKNLADTQFETLEFLKQKGFQINPNNKLCKNLEEIKNYYNYWQKHRQELDYAVDGVVIKVNDLKQQEQLGIASKFPNWAIAYKFPSAKIATRIKNVEFNTGRTGLITPVAVIKPVFIDGTTISRVSLGSIEKFKKMDFRKNDLVYIEKIGSVIPQITEIDKSKREIFASKFSYSTNLSKKHIQKQKLIHFSSRNAMNIRGLGKSLISDLVDMGLANDFGDLYKLKKEDLLKLDNIRDKKSNKIILAIQNSKNRPLANLICALGIEGVGFETSQYLAQKYNSIYEIYNAPKNELCQINGIGEKTADSIKFFLQHNIKLIKKLDTLGVKNINLS